MTKKSESFKRKIVLDYINELGGEFKIFYVKDKGYFWVFRQIYSNNLSLPFENPIQAVMNFLQYQVERIDSLKALKDLNEWSEKENLE